MEINIKLMSEEAYATLAKNPADVLKKINEHPSDSSWLREYLGFEPYETKTYTIEDFELKNSENYIEVALENTKLLYEHLRCLPKYILCDMKFWAWVTFEKAYKQSFSTRDINESFVKNTLFSKTNRRHLMNGVISRYFFMAEISARNTSKGLDYSLTEYALENQELYRLISYANFGMVKNVSVGLFRAMRDYSATYGPISGEQSRVIFKYATKLSSIRLVDLMSEDEVYDYCYKKIEKTIGTDDIVIDFTFDD